MSHPGKPRALLATLRIANAPSVVSNVFLGFLAAWVVRGGTWEEASRLPWLQIAGLSVAGLLLYFSGNLANDWYDRKWDESRRPERALPSGLFRPGSYLTASILCALLGIALSFSESLVCGIAALGIALFVVIYTWSHKRSIWSVIPMGLCRAGLYFLGAGAVWSRHGHEMPDGGFGMLFIAAMLGVGLASYIAGLSLSARYEGMGDAPAGPRLISKGLLLLPLAFAAIYPGSVWGWIGIVPFVLWLALSVTRFGKPIPRYVSALLAGIPLVDLMSVTGLSSLLVRNLHESGSVVAVACLPLIPIVAFISGRALQKLAPAT